MLQVIQFNNLMPCHAQFVWSDDGPYYCFIVTFATIWCFLLSFRLQSQVPDLNSSLEMVKLLTSKKVLFYVMIQGSKLKKWLGRLLVTNWRNLVARCKFLVASLYNQKSINFGAG